MNWPGSCLKGQLESIALELIWIGSRYGTRLLHSFVTLFKGLGCNHGKGAAAEKLRPPCGRQGVSPLETYQVMSPERGGGVNQGLFCWRGSEKGTHAAK